MNKHDILCKYFAGAPEYFDSETNKRIDWWKHVVKRDGNVWRYRKYNTYEWYPCYQKKDVTGLSIVLNTLTYIAEAIVYLLLFVCGCAVLYTIAYCNYRVFTGQYSLEDDLYFLGSVVSWAMFIIFFAIGAHGVLSNLKVDECVLGKDGD